LTTDINLPFITADAWAETFDYVVNRAKLEELVGTIIDRCRHPLEQALTDAKLTSAQVDRIIMVGGPTRMPIVQKFLEIMSARKLSAAFDPMECVALGPRSRRRLSK